MNDTPAHLVDRVLPDVAVRQWGVSLPHKYRFLIARDAPLLHKVLGILVSVLFALLVQQAQSQGIQGGRPGGIVVYDKGSNAKNGFLLIEQTRTLNTTLATDSTLCYMDAYVP